MQYILIIASYLLGSIPNALWIGKVFKKLDVREYGSGNVGATNASRILGKKLGLMTLILDILKGFIPVLIARYLNFSEINIILVALATVLGHSYSVYLKFRGGKAVATTIGIVLAIMPKTLIFLFFIFILIMLFTGYVSMASMFSAISLPFLAYLLYNNKYNILLSIILAILIVYRHKSNIINLINKKEDKYFEKAKRK